MTLCPPITTRALLAAPLLLATLVVACETGDQPAVCEAYLACFYPEDEVNRDAVGSPSAEIEAEAEAAFGVVGECWRNGPEDRFYKICEQTCADVVQEECRLHREEGDRACVRTDANGDLVFLPPESSNTPDSAIQCLPPATEA